MSTDVPTFLVGVIPSDPSSTKPPSSPARVKRTSRRRTQASGDSGLSVSAESPLSQSPSPVSLLPLSLDSAGVDPHASPKARKKKVSRKKTSSSSDAPPSEPAAAPKPESEAPAHPVKAAAESRVATLDSSSVTRQVHDQMLRSTIIRCLRGLGIEENQVHSIMSQIKRSSNSPAAKVLVHPPTHLIFKKIATEIIFPYLDQQMQTQHLIRIQSLARARIARLRFLELKRVYIGTQLGIRLDLFRAIVRGDRESLAVFNRLIRVYYRPLRAESQKKNGLLPQSDVSALFSNLPEIVKRFKHAYTQLIALRSENWPAVTGLGQHFLSMLGLFDLIVVHASNIQYASDTLDRLQSSKPVFAQFMRKALLLNPGLGHFDFPTLVRWPLQYSQTLQARLEAYLAYTPETEEFAAERRDLALVCTQLQEFSQKISQAQEASSERSRVLNINRQLNFETENLESSLQLTEDLDRHFIREGSVIFFDSKKKSSERYLIMFSDLLLLPRGQAPNYHLSPSDVLKLDHYTIHDNVDLEAELGLKGVKSEQFPVFKLVLDSSTLTAESDRARVTSSSSSSSSFSTSSSSSSSTSSSSSSSSSSSTALGCLEPVWYLSAPSSAEKQIWFLKLQKQMQLNKQVFGIDLSQMLLNESVCDAQGIPNVVRFCCSQLLQRGLRSVGLFRISPDKSPLKRLIQQFNRGLIRSEEVLTNVDIAVVSEVLKVFFRSLPEPLITFTISEQLTQSENSVDVPALLTRLPPANRKILDYLMNFLVRVCQFSDMNKMTPSNVAIVFGPNLIREKHETLESSMRMPRVNSSTEDIMNHYIAQFSEPPLVLPSEETSAPVTIPSYTWPNLDSSDDDVVYDPLDSAQAIPTPRTKTPSSSSSRSTSSDIPEKSASASAFPGIRVIEVDNKSKDSKNMDMKEVQNKMKSSRKGVSASLSFKRKNRPSIDSLFNN